MNETNEGEETYNLSLTISPKELVFFSQGPRS